MIFYKVNSFYNMPNMFYKLRFNGEISDWNVSKVEDMLVMFVDANFNQDISKWKIKKSCDVMNMFLNCPIKEKYKPKLPK